MAEVDAIRVRYRHLFQSTYLALLLGCPTHRRFLFWAVFALYNGILSRIDLGLDRY